MGAAWVERIEDEFDYLKEELGMLTTPANELMQDAITLISIYKVKSHQPASGEVHPNPRVVQVNSAADRAAAEAYTNNLVPGNIWQPIGGAVMMVVAENHRVEAAKADTIGPGNEPITLVQATITSYISKYLTKEAGMTEERRLAKQCRMQGGFANAMGYLANRGWNEQGQAQGFWKEMHGSEGGRKRLSMKEITQIENYAVGVGTLLLRLSPGLKYLTERLSKRLTDQAMNEEDENEYEIEYEDVKMSMKEIKKQIEADKWGEGCPLCAKEVGHGIHKAERCTLAHVLGRCNYDVKRKGVISGLTWKDREEAEKQRKEMKRMNEPYRDMTPAVIRQRRNEKIEKELREFRANESEGAVRYSEMQPPPDRVRAKEISEEPCKILYTIGWLVDMKNDVVGFPTEADKMMLMKREVLVEQKRKRVGGTLKDGKMTGGKMEVVVEGVVPPWNTHHPVVGNRVSQKTRCTIEGLRTEGEGGEARRMVDVKDMRSGERWSYTLEQLQAVDEDMKEEISERERQPFDSSPSKEKTAPEHPDDRYIYGDIPKRIRDGLLTGAQETDEVRKKFPDEGEKKKKAEKRVDVLLGRIRVILMTATNAIANNHAYYYKLWARAVSTPKTETGALGEKRTWVYDRQMLDELPDPHKIMMARYKVAWGTEEDDEEEADDDETDEEASGEPREETDDEDDMEEEEERSMGGSDRPEAREGERERQERYEDADTNGSEQGGCTKGRGEFPEHGAVQRDGMRRRSEKRREQRMADQNRRTMQEMRGAGREQRATGQPRRGIQGQKAGRKRTHRGGHGRANGPMGNRASVTH